MNWGGGRHRDEFGRRPGAKRPEGAAWRCSGGGTCDGRPTRPSGEGGRGGGMVRTKELEEADTEEERGWA